MVFESVLVQVLNRVLGDYIENLDTKQLNVGIWGGDVQLRNLKLKRTVLEGLDLPIQAIYGSIGNLVLKIPWKNLYSAAFVINVEDIYLIAAPNQEIKYDPIKEEQQQYDLKLIKIRKLEEANQKELDKDKPKPDPTFVEKLITQIIRNLQLNIKNIHIRYEDHVTNIDYPFALGVTLAELNVVSTDEDWIPAITKEALSKIFKVVELEGLSVYWNCNSTSYKDIDDAEITEVLSNEIANKVYKPPGYKYVLGPINATARLKLNQTPESDVPAFSIPKIDLNFDMEKLAIGVSKAQYRDIVSLSDSMSRMSKGVPFRKYRPHLQEYSGHAKEWWKFAITSILETEVKRKRNDWDWEHIKRHRDMCREYKDGLHKLANKSCTRKELEPLEKNLDWFNIIRLRQQVNLETEKLSLLTQKTETKSWFGGWFGGSKNNEVGESANLVKQFEAAMTPAEKNRLYAAIDYHESVSPTEYPESFVDVSASFLLRTLELHLEDESVRTGNVLLTEFNGVKCVANTRSAANGITVNVKIDQFVTHGMKQGKYLPKIITSENTNLEHTCLLEVLFELNPLDKICDTRLHLKAHPIKVVYDGLSILQVLEIFKIPSDALDEFSAAAGDKMNDFSKKSTLGLQYAIDKHTKMDINVVLHAPVVIIPYRGIYEKKEKVLVANLGTLHISSVPRGQAQLNVRTMFETGKGQDEILNEMIKQSYDKFDFSFKDLQVLIAETNENWREAVQGTKHTPMHLLTPISLNLSVLTCLVSDDYRLPVVKIEGELPSIQMNVSDARLVLLLSLIDSIPLPKGKEEENEDVLSKITLKSKISAESSVLKQLKETSKQATKHKKQVLALKPKLSPELANMQPEFLEQKSLDARFVMSEFTLTLTRQDHIFAPAQKLSTLELKSLEVSFAQQTYSMLASAKLGSISVINFYKDKVIHCISTPLANETEHFLFKVDYIMVDKKSPDFRSKYKSCESRLDLDFQTLEINVHQESILNLLRFNHDLQGEISASRRGGSWEKQRRHSSVSNLIKRTISSGSLTGKDSKSRKNVVSKNDLVVETITLKLGAKLKKLKLMFTTENKQLAMFLIDGIKTDLIIKSSYTQINAVLQTIELVNLDPKSMHKKIVEIHSGEDAINTCIVINNLEPNEEIKSNIVVDAHLGGLRIVFLNVFLTRMLNFMNTLQEGQNKILEASQAYAETAKQNIESVYEKATKISLNINLKAPDVIFPINSRSSRGVLLDMGSISVKNQFLSLETNDKSGNLATVDEIKVILSNFKLSRIRLKRTNYTDIEEEKHILQPLSCKVTLKRNLSLSWYNVIPDLDISGKMEKIIIQLSHGDYSLIMTALSQNFAEAEKLNPPAVEVINTRSSEQATILLPSIKENEPILTVTPKVHSTLKFTFTMDNWEILLLSSSQITSAVKRSVSQPISSTSELFTSEKNCLGRFSLEGFSLKGSMLSNHTMSVSILLLNCYLEDLRATGHEHKINRLIERTKTPNESPGKVKSMIDVTFKQSDDEMFADVRFFSATIILSLEYLLKLLEFFTVEPMTTEPTSTKGQPIKSVTVKQSASSAHMTKSIHSQPPVQKKPINMTINLKMEKPDIFLVENLNDIDTYALVLNSEIQMKYRVIDGRQIVNGSVRNLQLYQCCYNPDKRVESKFNVLHPVTISIAGSTPEGKGLHVELIFTQVKFSVTPATIELLSSCSAALSSGGDKSLGSDITDYELEDLWQPTPYNEKSYWFFRTDVQDALQIIDSHVFLHEKKNESIVLEELCIVSIPIIVITVEAGLGSKTVPLLLMESSFSGSVRNWSSKINIESNLTLSMGYYNGKLACWEPLIEPVEVMREDKPVSVPWQLRMDVSKNPQEEANPASFDNPHMIKPPVTSIEISSDLNLEITITKTFLEVINDLTNVFSNAMAQRNVKQSTDEFPYKFINETGETVILLLKLGSFNMVEKYMSQVVLEHGAQTPLKLKPSSFKNVVNTVIGNQLGRQNKQIQHKYLFVKMNLSGVELELPVTRADKRFFSIPYGDYKSKAGVVLDIKVENCITIITLRSVLQISNHFNVPIEGYYMQDLNKLASFATIAPGECVNVPTQYVYTPTSEIFFSVEDYSVTTIPFVWSDLVSNPHIDKFLNCKSKEVDGEDFTIKALGELEQVFFENTNRHTIHSTCFNIHLRPAVKLVNCLPIDIICVIENVCEDMLIKPGDNLLLHNVTPGQSGVVIRLPDYLEKEWSAREVLAEKPQDLSVWTFTCHEGPVKAILHLGMHALSRRGTMVMSLYCPFWMLNKTGLMISYRNSDDAINSLYHPPNFVGPVLYSFSAKHFFGKKKAAIRVEQGTWSDKFSLDVAGSSGMVCCKINERLYQIGVQNQLTYNGLTKQVTFTPYFVVINNAPFVIQFQENNRPADAWISVKSKECAAFWPLSDYDDKLIKVRVDDTVEITAPFLITESHSALLKLNNKYGGISVEVQVTEGGTYITLTEYIDGAAPVLILNNTRDTMNIWERLHFQIRKLPPNHSMLYAWENPSGPRVLVWEIGNKHELENDLRRDGLGEYKVANYTIYWASFLDGMQRILLFTEDPSVAENVQSAKQFELIDQELTVSIHGLCLSLVNNERFQEILYMAIASSGIIWEQSKMASNRYKHFPTKESIMLEKAYQRYLVHKSSEYVGDNLDPVHLEDPKYEVDFQLNILLKPQKRKIRRSFRTGLWIQKKSNAHQVQIHAKINKVQLDNQMSNSIFPVVLSPVIPGKTLSDKALRPFIEVSIVQLIMLNSNIKQFKYFKVLIQEFHIKVDLDFVSSVLEVLDTKNSTEGEDSEKLLLDMKLATEPLFAVVSSQSSKEAKSFYDILHFSPLKIHVSFSMASSPTSEQQASMSNFLKVLLQGVGVTITDMQDVVFKLAYFERESTFLTQKQLISEASGHYIGQGIKQLYVLVLGLDVLGNPYGLVMGITKGVEDLFYEPIQGAIQGPGEFAEGLVLGVRSLFGHTVGGAAGAVSRITGAMGKGIAALTFDDDYQRKRNDNKKPHTVQEGIARSGKGLVMGVVDGVTGVFTKPISGAKEGGVGGFFKGLGKGAVGLVTRPTSGVIDFASGSLDAVKRVTDSSVEAHRLRPTRFLHSDGLVTPYNQLEAIGYSLLLECDKGKFASTDFYKWHFTVIPLKEEVILTDQRIIYATRNELFGGWQTAWSYTWSDIMQPNVNIKGVFVGLIDHKKKLFGHGETGKQILIDDSKKSEEVCKKIQSLRAGSPTT